MAMRDHLAAVILSSVIVLVHFVLMGYGSPLFDSNNRHSWLDKLPSLEVKVKTDGITVRTGPSRDEIYSLALYICLGVASLILLTILAILVYKCCPTRGAFSSSNQATFPGIENVSLRPSCIASNPVTNFHMRPHVSSQMWPLRLDMDTNISPQHSDLRNTKYPDGNCVSTNPYRSTS